MQPILALKIITGNYPGTDYSCSPTDTARLTDVYVAPHLVLLVTARWAEIDTIKSYRDGRRVSTGAAQV